MALVCIPRTQNIFFFNLIILLFWHSFAELQTWQSFVAVFKHAQGTMNVSFTAVTQTSCGSIKRPVSVGVGTCSRSARVSSSHMLKIKSENRCYF